MNKYILVITFLSTASYCVGQTEYRFTPQWKAGDKKTAIIEQRETEYKDGKLVEDTTIYLDTKMTVVKENKDDYIFTIVTENAALRAAINFYDKLGEELTGYKDLELKYRVDKHSGKAELINWKEARQFMTESFGQITALLKKKAPEMAGFAKLAFAPIEEVFKSKENVEAYMNDEIGYMLFPFGKTFVIGDTLRITDRSANPFNPMDTISQTTFAYLTNIDKSKKVCDINSTIVLDLDGFKEMMKSMMEKMSEAFGAADSTKNNASKEIDSIEFDVTNLTVITFDYGTTWPVKVVKTAKVYVSAPDRKSEKTVLTTVTIK